MVTKEEFVEMWNRVSEGVYRRITLIDGMRIYADTYRFYPLYLELYRDGHIIVSDMKVPAVKEVD